MTLNRRALFQLFKYAVYLLLAMNIYWFFIEEHAAVKTQFAGGLGLFDIIEAYVATIDTAAWVILLFMFELETFVLDDEHFTPPVKLTLHGLQDRVLHVHRVRLLRLCCDAVYAARYHNARQREQPVRIG